MARDCIWGMQMHTRLTSERPRWLAFYDLAMACGAFQSPPAAAHKSAPEISEGAFAGLATLSVMTLPAKAVVDSVLGA
jgi:hypothetical protein